MLFSQLVTEAFTILLQLIVALGLLNVWLIRFGQKTAYRGGSATSMKEEFAVYGLPPVMLYIVGGLKIAGALMLIAGIWIAPLVIPAAAVIAILMVGALAMHLKVQDPAIKSLPAASVMILSVAIILLQSTPS